MHLGPNTFSTYSLLLPTVIISAMATECRNFYNPTVIILYSNAFCNKLKKWFLEISSEMIVTIDFSIIMFKYKSFDFVLLSLSKLPRLISLFLAEPKKFHNTTPQSTTCLSAYILSQWLSFLLTKNWITIPSLQK